MSKQVELKVLSSAQFAKAIQEIVEEANGQITHLDAVQEFLANNEDVEPETLASLIQRNQKLKAILYEDAEQLNLVVKESRLPVDE
jgi:ferritin-like metal-binding protein YciE|tara:strand:- start:187 stop:444 length:258 start_codon:yes stop_codon:yes gene_type:complete